MSEACISVAIPNGVDPDSWLNEPAYASFRAAYVYASRQSSAIQALSDLPAERVYHLYEALKRGEENFERRAYQERERAKEEYEADTPEMVGTAWREVKARAGGRYTITLAERIPYWGWKAEHSKHGVWQLTDWALADYYEPVLAEVAQDG